MYCDKYEIPYPVILFPFKYNDIQKSFSIKNYHNIFHPN